MLEITSNQSIESFLYKKYPHLQCTQTWSGIRYLTYEVNSLVDNFEQICANGYLFYLEDQGIKIYAEPMGVYTKTDCDQEVDWLPELLEDDINPLVLVKLIRHINSQYLSEPYFHKKYPYLPEWLGKFP